MSTIKTDLIIDQHAPDCLLRQFHAICCKWEVRVYFGTAKEKAGFYQEVRRFFKRHNLPDNALAPDCSCGRKIEYDLTKLERKEKV